MYTTTLQIFSKEADNCVWAQEVRSCTFTIIRPTQSDLVRSISWRPFGAIYNHFAKNVPFRCECGRVSILYLKQFVFPYFLPGAFVDESNWGPIYNRVTHCKALVAAVGKWNVFVLILKCICHNFQMYLS